MLQMKKQKEPPQKQLNEMEVSNLPDKVKKWLKIYSKNIEEQ